MSVLLETTLGDVVVDLLVDDAPLASCNFIKLCKMKYYNNCEFLSVDKNFLAICGDARNDGGGCAKWQLNQKSAAASSEVSRFIPDEIRIPKVTHARRGTVGMATEKPNSNGSKFYITLRDGLDHLDGAHTIFGSVAEEDGLKVLEELNTTPTDNQKRPFLKIRIKHAVILDDPFLDFADEEDYDSPSEVEEAADAQGLAEENLLQKIQEADARSQAVTLQLLGDLPDADIKAPENVLFIAKLNPVTQDADLELLFSRFGHIRSCEIIRDYKTGDSLQYGFLEFESEKDCEAAFFKMQGVLVDGRRIHVDFSQSVSKAFNGMRTGGISGAEAAELLSGGDHGAGPSSSTKGGKKGGKFGGGKGSDLFGGGLPRTGNANAVPLGSVAAGARGSRERRSSRERREEDRASRDDRHDDRKARNEDRRGREDREDRERDRRDHDRDRRDEGRNEERSRDRRVKKDRSDRRDSRRERNRERKRSR